MEWGWTGTLSALKHRLDNLESSLLRKTTSVPTAHEIETMPCLSQDRTGTDMVGTHSAANLGRVFAVPFRFSGQIHLRRMSLICAATAGNTANVGLCLYAMDDPSRVDQADPRTEFRPRLRRVDTGSWAATDGIGHVVLTVDYPRGTYLNTSGALYFATWTMDDDEGRVFCPNSGPGGLDAKSFLAAFTSDGTASPSGGFPDTLSITGDTDARAAPCVVGRSLSGLRVFGSFADDI